MFLFLSLILLLTTQIPHGMAVQSTSTSLSSQGSISYAPAPIPRRLIGVDFFRIVPDAAPYDQSPLQYYNLLDLIKNTGKINTIRIHVSVDGQWSYFDTAYPNAKIWTQQAFQEARAKGIKTILAAFAPANSATYMADVILNVNGKGDEWITRFSQAIQECQPDAIEIMNEPPGKWENPNLTFQAYRDFVVRASTAYRAVKPDISLQVMGSPYYNLNDIDGTGSWATKPLTEFSDVTYDVHLYYDRDSISVGAPFTAAYQSGNLAQAKTLLYNYILNTVGLQSLLSKGLPVIFGEFGVEPSYPNWEAFLLDMYSFIDQYDMGSIQHALSAEPHQYALLTSDWAHLSEMGLFWKQYAPTP